MQMHQDMNASKRNVLAIEKSLFDKIVDFFVNAASSANKEGLNRSDRIDNKAVDYRIRQLMMENEALRKKADKFEKQAKQLSSIIENTSEGIFQTTPTGKYIFANKPLAEIYDYDDTNELMFNLNDIAKQLYVDPHKRLEFMDVLEKNDRVIDFESEVRTSTGKTIWIKENARAVRDETGEIQYYEGTVEDITAKKMAEVEIDRMQSHI